MKLDFNLNLQQQQKLIMTQELQLAVKILQLTSFELREYIQEQLIENPMLEAVEKENPEQENKNDDDKVEYLIDLYNDDRESYYQPDEDEEYVSPLNFVVREETLWEYLKEQLNLLVLDKELLKVGEYIIDNIDQNGYLTIDAENISEKFKITYQEAEKMINLIQTFEPAGIGARNISECLLIQVRNKGYSDKILENIILNMLEDVAEGRVVKIARENGITVEKASEYIDIIKKLEPKPGVAYSSDTVKYIVPDVIVEKIDNRYIVTVNEEYIPDLRINNLYKKIIKDKNSPEYKFIKERLDSALWLIKSIEQRTQTIKRVMEAIVEYQMDFFEKDEELKPLSLHQIAEATNLHESTVSRAIKGKYVQTPKGLFEIKRFFPRGMQSKSGEEIATIKIKGRIKEIIENEDKKKPYSDQQIADKLGSEGLKVSRRTVAKYREEMGIQSSSKRKSY
ncbi:RNA polymerase factor sigma-54 [Fonticella tunisiensis]|uniref:RNA polymerase RpoN-/SigL-like sigma 54 subunit n=1 Tax=Fonticella tunisiensis TaxID=1096341 RepID=A0A4R7KAN3_9CLOT|nr:RNA polymerase factor sigma-54 [Fonticella tunisiensis]TDT50743.1 RNA polymerase RpoN-/SigL-like sigma 54 subunit [Fonticella tunisiensis]